jgi:HK97 family phage major capsid protein
MDNFEELKGLLKEVIGDKKVKDDEAKTRDDRIKAIEAMTVEQKAKIEKIESTVVKLNIGISGDPSTELFLGYKLSDQFMNFSPTYRFVDRAKAERHSKFLITVIKAGMGDRVAKDLTEGAPTGGGYAVPVEYQTDLLAFATLSSVALAEANVVPMGTKDVKWAREDAYGTGSWENEQVDFDQAEPTLGQVTLTAVRRGSFAKATKELLSDATFDISAYLTKKSAEDIGQAVDARCFGSNAAYGLAGAAITQHIDLNAGGLVMPDGGDALDAMQSELPPNKIIGAKYFMHRKILHKIKVLKDQNDNYVYCAPAGPLPGTIWQYPYSLVEVMTATDSTGDVCVTFGNLKQYIIGRRADMSLLVDPYTYGKSDQVLFIFSSRFAHAIAQPTAFVNLIG